MASDVESHLHNVIKYYGIIMPFSIIILRIFHWERTLFVIIIFRPFYVYLYLVSSEVTHLVNDNTMDYSIMPF